MKTSQLLFISLVSFSIVSCKPNPPVEQKSASPMPSESVATSTNKPTDCEFTLGFDAWEPYQYQDIGDQVSGLDIELVEAVVTEMGCRLTFKQGTWVSLLADLKGGEVDILLGASKTKAREEFALFSDAYRTEEFSLYIRKEDDASAAYTSLPEFIQNNSKIGIVGDYYYGPEVSILLEGSATSSYFVNAMMTEINVARLLDSDIDAFIEDTFVGATLIRRKALANYIVAQGITFQTGNAYVMFSKTSVSPEQLADFNLELAKIKDGPLYQSIFEKYAF